MDAQTYLKDVEDKSAEIDRGLSDFLSAAEPVENLHDGLLYALGLDIEDRAKRGKRVRPVLCLQTCEALGGDPRDAMPFACAMEMAHNFFLIHDDFEDGDRVRRDRASVWVRYGAPHGINIGDYMYTKVFVMMAGIGDAELAMRLMRLLVDTLDHTHIGQALDINARQKREFTLDDYLEIVREKTGYYLAAPILGGAIVAGADDETIEAVKRFGHYVGPMFQIIDDLIDLSEGKGRGQIGSDVREGKRSYLVAWTLERAAPDERERLLDILDAKREETSDKMVHETIELFTRHGALEGARQYTDQLFQEAMETLKGVPEPLARLLKTAFEFLSRRTR